MNAKAKFDKAMFLLNHNRALMTLGDKTGFIDPERDWVLENVLDYIIQELGAPPKERKQEEPSGVCSICGAPMVARLGKYGAFLGCSTYPKCNGTHHI